MERKISDHSVKLRFVNSQKFLTTAIRKKLSEIGLSGFGRAQNFLAARLLSQKKIPNDKSGIISLSRIP
jgi:hypothetical protein